MRIVLILEAVPPQSDILTGVIFEDTNYLLCSLKSPEEILALSSAYKPDLFLFDEQLPGSTGEALVQQLRGRPEGCDVPIIILGAWEKKTAGFLTGVTYLQAPCTQELILKTIAALCNATEKLKKKSSEKLLSLLPPDAEGHENIDDSLIQQERERCARRLVWLDQRRDWLDQRQEWLNQRNGWIEARSKDLYPQQEWLAEQRDWLKQQQEEVDIQSRKLNDLRYWLLQYQKKLDDNPPNPYDRRSSS